MVDEIGTAIVAAFALLVTFVAEVLLEELFNGLAPPPFTIIAIDVAVAMVVAIVVEVIAVKYIPD